MDTPWHDRFEQILREAMGDHGQQAPLDADTTLNDLGIGSFEAIGLIISLEAAYGVTLPVEMLVAQDASTPRELWTHVRRQLDADAPQHPKGDRS